MDRRVVTTVRLPSELAEWLAGEAGRCGVSKTAVLERVLREASRPPGYRGELESAGMPVARDRKAQGDNRSAPARVSRSVREDAGAAYRRMLRERQARLNKGRS